MSSSISHDDVMTFLDEDLGVDTGDIEHSTLLFSSGLVDSFSLVNIMMFLETNGNFKISAADVNLDNFDSVDRIVAFASTQTG